MIQDAYSYDFNTFQITICAYDAITSYPKLASLLGVPREFWGKAISAMEDGSSGRMYRALRAGNRFKPFHAARDRCTVSLRYLPSDSLFFVQSNPVHFSDLHDKNILHWVNLIGDERRNDMTEENVEFRVYFRAQKDFPRFILTLAFFWEKDLNKELFIIGHIPLFLRSDNDFIVDGTQIEEPYEPLDPYYTDEFGDETLKIISGARRTNDKHGYSYWYS